MTIRRQTQNQHPAIAEVPMCVKRDANGIEGALL
jgi:hypothetical protein